MTIFSCDGLTKTRETKLLFENVSFGISSGERIGLIGKNGVGKTTLIDVIVGKTQADFGDAVFNSDVRYEYLEQEPFFDSDETVIEAMLNSRRDILDDIDEHRALCRALEENYDDKAAMKIEALQSKIESSGGWNFERECEKILSKLGIPDIYQSVATLSGGLKKRAALARALVSDPDLLILDEPTNHLDADSVQWLQDRLMNSAKSLVFISHDRYFLDAVSTRILELDQERLFSYPGNYEKYLEHKQTFLKAQESATIHMKSRLLEELAWLQKGAKARRTKQKSRIDQIEKLASEIKTHKDKKIKIELGKKFVGSRVIEAVNVSKSIGGRLLFEKFNYFAKPGDRIGIIGPNGSGKSTLLNLLAGGLRTDTGSVKIGQSIDIGYFEQELTSLKPFDSPLSTLKEIAEYIDVGFGRHRYLTCRDLLNKFNFPHNRHGALIKTLSGGEKRRLGLLKVFMKNPNVLFLDEPTNDLDIQTLRSLEEYLEDFYGVLLAVSHDRAFLDRTVDFIWAFDGKGRIREYPGNYSAYLEKKEIEDREIRAVKAEIRKEEKKNRKPKEKKPSGKLTFKEKLELEKLESEISEIESQKNEIDSALTSGEVADYKRLQEMGKASTEMEEKIEELTLRWLELSEKGD